MDDKPKLNPAEIEFSKVFGRTFKLWSELWTIQAIIKKGLPSGVDQYAQQAQKAIEKYYKSGDLAQVLYEPEKATEMYEQLRTAPFVPQQAGKAISTLDAAIIVFGHSILEENIFGYLRVVAMAKPEVYKPFVEERKIAVMECYGKTYEQILSDKIDEFLIKTVEKESLMYKVDTFHKVAPPDRIYFKSPTWEYDRTRIERFDAARHTVVHGNR